MVFDEQELKNLIKKHKLKTQGDLRNLLKQFSKDLFETMLKEEFDDHLGYEKYDKENKTTDNSRNGQSSKVLKTDFGNLEINMPRDRKSTFKPIVIPKGSRILEGFEEKVLYLYSHGVTQRDICGYVEDIYGIQLSPEAVSSIIESVTDKVQEWQNRSLKEFYTVMFMDAIIFKVRQNGQVKNMAVNTLVGIDIDGKKEIIGYWTCENESAKFWLNVLNDLKSRGVKDVLIFCVDGLKGFPEAIKATFPQSDIQRCIVHQIRSSTKYVNYKDRKTVCADLKGIYQASTEDEALHNLEVFQQKWNAKYPYISQSWLNNWDTLSTYFKYPNEIRRLIYTTNTIESINSIFRKLTKNRNAFPDEMSLFRLLYLGNDELMKKWTMPIRDWNLIFSQLCIIFEERIQKYAK